MDRPKLDLSIGTTGSKLDPPVVLRRDRRYRGEFAVVGTHEILNRVTEVLDAGGADGVLKGIWLACFRFFLL